MPDKGLPAAFVTFGWCRSAYTVCRALSARGVAVHVGDSSRLAMTRFSRYCSSYTRLPNFFLSPAEYVREVVQAMRAKDATVLLPCSEDIEVVLRYRDLLPSNIALAAPELGDWNIAEDKLEYLERVSEYGCPVPNSAIVTDIRELGDAAESVGYPLMVKVRNGNGSRGIAIVNDKENLHATFDRLIDEYELPVHRWPILQQKIIGPKYQMDGVFANGKFARDGVYEILRAKGTGLFGTSTYRITVDRPDIQRAAYQAMSALRWHGIFNLDWLCDDAGTPYLIDINGRLGGAVSILYEAGLDLPWFWYQLALGELDLPESTAKPGIATKWLLGEMLAVIEHAAARDFRGAGRVLFGKGPKAKAFDDLIWRDPAPFFFQGVDYVAKFAGSRGSLRPTVKGMVR